jgi:hypothetical protein
MFEQLEAAGQPEVEYCVYGQSGRRVELRCDCNILVCASILGAANRISGKGPVRELDPLRGWMGSNMCTLFRYPPF